MRLCRLGVPGNCIRSNHASLPRDAARSSGVGKIARATRYQRRTVAKCILRVHLSSAGRGRRVFAACHARRQCQNGRVTIRTRHRAEHREKRAHHKIASTHSLQIHTCNVLKRRSARGTQNTRAPDTLAAANMTRSSGATLPVAEKKPV
jgi:hypothetical protein